MRARPMPVSQRGVYVVLVPFVLIALFGLIGLTLTSGYAFTDRSKLQNLLDAMALAGAAQVNMMNARPWLNQQDKCAAPPVNPPTGVLGVRRAVMNVLLYTTATPGNEALGAAIAEEDVIIQYATSLSSGAFSTACPQTDSSQPIYVRIRLRQPIDTPIGFSDFLMGIIQPWLVDERYDLRISGSAVAGPAAAAPVWDDRRCPFPIFLCDQTSNADPGCQGEANGDLCSFGYPKYSEGAFLNGGFGCLPAEASGGQGFLSTPIEAGKRASLAGVRGACPVPPNAMGQIMLDDAQDADTFLMENRGAFNTRFYSRDQWPGIPAGQYPTDFLAPGQDGVMSGLGEGSICGPLATLDLPNSDRALIDSYVETMVTTTSPTGTQPLRRIVNVPVIGCDSATEDGPYPVRGYACVLLTRGMRSDVIPDTSQHIAGEIIDAGLVQGLCGASTVIGRSDSRPPVSGQLPPLWRIVLYKTPGAGDS
ncbi:hypothetical protein EWI61_01095 [Methylolobus aquaticus]|nr:hypothetical protein EWI61_01095 [Methylolobus aquaticus]